MIFRRPFPEMTLPDISLTSYIYTLDMSFVAERVTPCKRLRDVAFVAQMPQSTTGTILRRVLVAQEQADPHA